MSLSVLKVEPLRDDRQQNRRHHFPGSRCGNAPVHHARTWGPPGVDLSAHLEKRYHPCWFEILEKE
jgi:hypothetical protein